MGPNVVNLAGSRHSACFYCFWWVFFLLLVRYLQRFKIVCRRHAQKVNRPKFQFFKIFTTFYDFPMNIMKIKTKDAQSFFRKKVCVRLVLYTMTDILSGIFIRFELFNGNSCQSTSHDICQAISMPISL